MTTRSRKNDELKKNALKKSILKPLLGNNTEDIVIFLFILPHIYLIFAKYHNKTEYNMMIYTTAYKDGHAMCTFCR